MDARTPSYSRDYTLSHARQRSLVLVCLDERRFLVTSPRQSELPLATLPPSRTITSPVLRPFKGWLAFLLARDIPNLMPT